MSRLEFGLFKEFHCPAGMSEAAAFDESMAQMRAAEAFGFDALWLGELHFQKDRSVLASPLVAAAGRPPAPGASRSGSPSRSSR